jgi:hypothetical protein
MALITDQPFGVATTVEVGFTMRIVKRTPDVIRCDYHAALDTLMRALLTCFGSAHAEGTHLQPVTTISARIEHLPSDAQFRQLERAAQRINAEYRCLHVDLL